MNSYNELITLIDAVINRNGVQAITGQVLNGVLKAMVQQLGAGYSLSGVAHPTDDPGTPEQPVCYFASEVGTYTNFGGVGIVAGELALLCYDMTDGWFKETMYEGFASVGATIDGNVGTPSVDVTYNNGVLSFDFRNLKGNPGEDGNDGQDGAAAGFGTITASVDANVGTPSVAVTESGPDTAKNLAFAFHNLKGADGDPGVTSVNVTVDNTSGSPACAVSLNAGVLTLAFTGLKGAQGDTGSSVAYPFTIVNNLTTDDATQALSAAQGVVLDGKVTQLEAKMDEVYPSTKDLEKLGIVCNTERTVSNIGGTLTKDTLYIASRNGQYKIVFRFDDGLTWNTSYAYDLFGIEQMRGNTAVDEVHYRNTASGIYRAIVRTDTIVFTMQSGDMITFDNRLSGKIYFEIYEIAETPFVVIEGMRAQLQKYGEKVATGFEERKGTISQATTGWVWYTGAGKHIAIPVNPGDIFNIKASSSVGQDYAWATSSYAPPTANAQVFPIVPGTEKETIPANGTKRIVAPGLAAYLIVPVVNGANVRTYGQVFYIGKDGVAVEQVIDNSIGLDGDIHPYTGQKITLLPKFGLKKVGGVTTQFNNTLYPQGMAIYGNYMFRLYDTGEGEIYDISSGTPVFVHAITLACSPDSPHCNAAQFANEIVAGDFPYLYVSACKTSARKCYVVTVDTDGTSSLIQTITFPELDELPSNMAFNAIVGDDGYLWAVGHKGTKLYFTKWLLPDTSGGDATLTSSELVDSWTEDGYDYDNYVCQGMAVYQGKIFLAYGGTYNNRGIWVYDSETKVKISNIDMTSYLSVEFEDVAIYDGRLYLQVVGNYYYILTF